MAELPMAESTAERCETCRFWRCFFALETETGLAAFEHANAWGASAGFCHRYPPSGGSTGGAQGAFPTTRTGEWCGEYQGRPVGTAPQSLLDRRLETTMLSVRGIRVARGLGATTVGQLASLTATDIRNAKGAGVRTLREIESVLSEFFLKLKSD